MRMRFPEPPPLNDVDEDEEPIEDEDLDEDYDEEDDIVDEPDEEIDENDPFYFSDGMHW